MSDRSISRQEKSLHVTSDLNFSRKKRLPVLFGVEAAECGLACVTMIARYYGHDVDLNSMRRKFSLSLAGATLQSIMDISDQIGFGARPLRVKLSALRRVKTPAILHWDLNHFVVLKKANRKGITIHNPAVGKRFFAYEEASKHFTGVVLELAPAKQFHKIKERQKTKITHLWTSISGFWPAIIQIFALTIALQVVVFASPFYMQLVIDDAIQSADKNLLTILALGFGALLIIQVAITALRSWALQSIGFLLSFQLVGNIVRHLLRLKTDYFEKRHVGDILSRIGSIDPIQSAITTGLISTVIDGIMAIIAVIILFLYSPLLTWIVIASLVLSMLTTFAFYPAQRKRMEEQIVVDAKEDSHIMESVRASTPIKLMGRETQREASWRNLFADVMNASFSVGKYEIGMTAAQGLITGLQTILVVYVAANIILSGNGFSIGMLFAFMSFRETLTERTLALVNQIIQFRFLSLHLDRVGDIIHAESDHGDDSNVYSFTTEGNISLHDVAFKYGVSDRWIFEDVSLDIKAGSFVTFIGPSGGGKTTLFKLMLGLYQPTKGDIRLDGQPASPALYRAWRNNIGVVSQDDQLLSGTLADNIAFFDADIDMKQVIKAAQDAQIHEDIQRMPMQYQSLVGDMGSTLSGGQRQRVLLARALYRSPKLLFLDEGTANLDEHTESEIADLVEQLPLTVISVAHRPALIEKATSIYIVKDGMVLPALPKHHRERPLELINCVPVPRQLLVDVLDFLSDKES